MLVDYQSPNYHLVTPAEFTGHFVAKDTEPSEKAFSPSLPFGSEYYSSTASAYNHAQNAINESIATISETNGNHTEEEIRTAKMRLAFSAQVLEAIVKNEGANHGDFWRLMEASSLTGDSSFAETALASKPEVLRLSSEELKRIMGKLPVKQWKLESYKKNLLNSWPEVQDAPPTSVSEKSETTYLIEASKAA